MQHCHVSFQPKAADELSQVRIRCMAACMNSSPALQADLMKTIQLASGTNYHAGERQKQMLSGGGW